MSIVTGDLWSRWVAVGRTCCAAFVFLELWPAPQNFLAPREQGLTFQRLFIMVAVPLLLSKWFVQLQSESGVLEI